jgi:hypothetical protein
MTFDIDSLAEAGTPRTWSAAPGVRQLIGPDGILTTILEYVYLYGEARHKVHHLDGI